MLSLCRRNIFVRVLASVRILIVHIYCSSKKQLYLEVLGMDKGGNGGEEEIDKRERGI